jgi:hypothetical protein
VFTGNVGIGGSPSEKLTVNGSIDLPTVNTFIKGGGHNVLQVDAAKTYLYGGTGGVQFRTADNASALVDITNTGNVGIGVVPETSSSGHTSFAVGGNQRFETNTVKNGGNYGSWMQNAHYEGSWKYISTGATSRMYQGAGTLAMQVAASGSAGAAISWTNAMTIDNSGNVLVGKSVNDNTTQGIVINGGSGFMSVSRDAGIALLLDRSNDGEIQRFTKNGSTVGRINIQSYGFEIQGESGHAGISFATVAWVPMNNGTRVDNSIDLGVSSYRFDDIYATNPTINTSDRNEKQDELPITTAESNVATACKGLLRSFRWRDAVAEKGDDARIHFGIIAQDLQDAFTAEGLDAGRYAMFISSTWWETQTEVPAVEAEDAVYEDVVVTPAQEAGFREVTPAVQAEPAYYDVDGNVIKEAVEASEAVHEATEAVAEVTESRIATEAVEAKDAYTRTDTFDTLEEAPEGATERTRLGVRYPELLSFIIAAL